eukprot:TRINITY_DN78233_c0_g1_i1.p2 TRINITY_DN78233_c0_g1~~TRINITY_DN78233_c0_g1_i1.p2  ORF type:complete len:100 (-),score=8.80 TRINITY_DN78233_c0_g1_i1:132-431(-)
MGGKHSTRFDSYGQMQPTPFYSEVPKHMYHTPGTVDGRAGAGYYTNQAGAAQFPAVSPPVSPRGAHVQPTVVSRPPTVVAVPASTTHPATYTQRSYYVA